jgi:hypothetical protein
MPIDFICRSFVFSLSPPKKETFPLKERQPKKVIDKRIHLPHFPTTNHSTSPYLFIKTDESEKIQNEIRIEKDPL